MENRIAITSLASLLSQTSGKSKKLCEDFLREFFKLTGEALIEGQPVKIKGFGTFKLTDVESRNSVNVNTGEPHEIAPHKKVVFTPAKELAASINAPFEDFESIEMEDDIPEDILNEEINYEEVRNEDISNEEEVSTQRLEEGSIEEGEDDDITYEAYHTPSQVDRIYDIEEAEKLNEEPNTEVEETGQTIKDGFPQEIYPPTKSRFGIGFLIGALSTFAVCAVIFIIGCFFDWWPVNFGNTGELAPESIELPIEQSEHESISETETLPEQEPVYDTVSTTRYLTTIAREHYGNYNFWPYIYIENESILGHPDRITPGTKVVVPDLSKYGVDPSKGEDVEQAKRKAVEIYSRFK